MFCFFREIFGKGDLCLYVICSCIHYPGIFADKSSRINWQVFSAILTVYLCRPKMSWETGIPCKVPKKKWQFSINLSGPFLTEPVDFGYVGKGHVHNPVMKPRYQTSVQEKAALLARKRDLEPCIGLCCLFYFSTWFFFLGSVCLFVCLF